MTVLSLQEHRYVLQILVSKNVNHSDFIISFEILFLNSRCDYAVDSRQTYMDEGLHLLLFCAFGIYLKCAVYQFFEVQFLSLPRNFSFVSKTFLRIPVSENIVHQVCLTKSRLKSPSFTKILFSFFFSFCQWNNGITSWIFKELVKNTQTKNTSTQQRQKTEALALEFYQFELSIALKN